MARFTRSDDLRGAEFVGTDLSGARFRDAELGGVVMRGVDIGGADIDAPWLLEGDAGLRVNGVDVAPLVDEALNRRFPGRALRRAGDPEGLRGAWAALGTAWDGLGERVAGMPEGTVDVQVDGEWSYTQTVRHLVLATDMWLGKAVLRLEQPFHPLGLMDTSTAGDDGVDLSPFITGTPTYAEVLDARADRVAMVRDFLDAATSEQLAKERANPHAPQYPETVLSCLHTILEEEWEHHRYAVRDLDTIAAR